MNWIDLIIVGAFIFYLFEGVRRGFIEQTLELIGFFVTIVFATWTDNYFGQLIADKTGIQESAAVPIAFFLSWVLYQLLFSLLLRFTYPLIPAKIRSALPNRLAGLVPSFTKGLVIVSLILTIIFTLPVPAQLKGEIEVSSIGSRFVNNSAIVEYYLNRALGQDLRQTLTFLTVPAQTEQIIQPNERVELKFSTTSVTTDNTSEQKMLSLMNEERVKVGVKPLVFDEALAKVARAHSTDMFAQGYFAHQNPDGLSPFDRMAKAGIKYLVAGENLAYAPSVELAHGGLMRSPGHKANILNVDYGHVGLGVIDGGIYGKMFTQNFTD